MATPAWIQKLQTRWGLSSTGQVLVILLVFALTGTSVLYVKKWIFHLIGIGSETVWWLRLLASIFIILPIYQVLLLAYGFLLGQFRFFWNFEKKMFARIAKLF